MPLSPGEKLGPYEITAPIGKGGMGEVYRAHDSRLKRDVAIKVSAAQFSERFEREAQAIAALNHPHICQLYDVGPNYLVMEYIAGAPLDGPLPVDQALKYAIQICDALDAAHKKGITHRDLKPSNILLTRQGIKLLDFGLAKFGSSGITPEPAGATLTMALTGKNEIVGTLYYMSPEQLQAQANGEEIDGRSDIFSFGLVLYEILTGKRAFEGSSPASVIAAIMERPAPSIADIAPAALDWVLKRCLEKDPDNRWQTARDLKAELERIASAPESGSAVPAAPMQKPRHVWLAWSVAVPAILFAFGVSFVHFRKKPSAPPEPVKFEITAPEKTTMQKFAVSPDGRKVAFLATDEKGGGGLWVRSLDSLEAHRIADTQQDGPPLFFWSPDSRSIAFPNGERMNKLERVDLSGDSPRTICEMDTVVAGGSWKSDGTILFGSAAGVWRVQAAGGSPVQLTAIDPSRQEQGHFTPLFLPDGKHFVYLRLSDSPQYGGVYVGSVDAKPQQQELKRLVATNLSPVYVPMRDPAMGRLLFMRESALMAQSLDLAKLEMTGEPVRLADHLGRAFEFGYFGASANGVLAYRSGAGGVIYNQLTWFDRRGKNLGAATPPGLFMTLALSPDGSRLAFARANVENAGKTHVWLLEFARNTLTRLSSDPAPDIDPVWSPDGARLAYDSQSMPATSLMARASNGADGEEKLLPGSGAPRTMLDWSHDGRFLLYAQVDPKTKSDLWILPAAPEKAGEARKPAVYLNSEFNETQGRFSPDGHWIAYVSDESGRSEVYVQPFPLTRRAGRITVSNDSGTLPRWRRDGKELFYLGANQRKLMSVDVAYTPSLKVGASKALFETPSSQLMAFSTLWDIAPDGNRFLFSTAATAGNAPQPPLTVVLNWTALLKE
jgi:Tol biopolymer transport system component/predicted Ser/Thr protein kinase